MERVAEVFDKVVDLAPGERAAMLQTIGDLGLRAEVERLLEAHDRAGREPDFMEKPVVEWTSSTESTSLPVFFSDQLVAERYRIIRFLGVGGMGQVFQAKDEVLRRFVALKTIRPEIASDPRILEWFKTEVRLAQEVADENVCRMFDMDHRNVPPFLTMEYLDGQTLGSRLRSAKRRMPTAEALPLVEQMGRGLQAAHVKGVVHGDFKPGNVMLIRTGSGATRAKVTDFGLARMEDPEGSLSSTYPRGTPSYMAPEQLLGAKAAVTSDIYALGLVIYEMVAGARPEFNRLIEPAPSPRVSAPDLDKNWEAAILRCLERDPAKRFTSAADLLRSLQGTSQIRVARPSRRAVLEAGLSLASLSLLGDTARVLRGKAMIRAGSSVLLNDVENLTQDPELDAVNEVLRSQLGQSPYFNLMEPGRIAEILRLMVQAPSRRLDPPVAREVAWRDGAPLVVYGTLSRLAQDYTLQLKIERIGNRPDAVVAGWHQTWTAPTKGELFDALQQGSRWIRARAGEAAVDIAAQDRPPRDITTSSWRALHLLMQANGKKALGDNEAAILRLKEAIQLDPDFAMAHMRLADILISMKRWEGYESWQKAIRLAEKHRLTRREELWIKGQYFQDTGDHVAAEQTFRSFVAQYPNDSLHSSFYLGSALEVLGRDGEAVQQFSEAAKRQPADFIPLEHLAVLRLRSAQFDQAQTVIDRIRSLGQRDWATWLEGTSHFLQGRFEPALRQVSELSDSVDDYWRSRSYAVRACWLSELGRYGEAVSLLQDGVAFDAPRRLNTSHADKCVLLAYLYYRQAKREACRQSCQQAVSLDSGAVRSAQAGTLLARAGFVTEARSLLAAMPRVPDIPKLRFNRQRLNGEIAMAQRERTAAVREFQAAAQLARPTAAREYLARALEWSGDDAGAMALYQWIVDHPGRIWPDPDYEFPGLWADALFQCARLAHRLGLKEAAGLADRYLEIRKGADPGLADVDEARKLWR